QAQTAAVTATKKSLEGQQTALANIMAGQKAQQSSLASAKAQAAQLLADTQGQEANYQSVVQANKQKLQQIYSQRAALDTRNHVTVSTGGNGG
ncbi:hypothetical protein ACTGUZ_11410, partial [Streptococcus suis]